MRAGGEGKKERREDAEDDVNNRPDSSLLVEEVSRRGPGGQGRKYSTQVARQEVEVEAE